MPISITLFHSPFHQLGPAVFLQLSEYPPSLAMGLAISESAMTTDKHYPIFSLVARKFK